VTVVAVAWLSATCCRAGVVIRVLDRHTNEISRRFRIESDRPLTGHFVWRLTAGERTLARGQQDVAIADAAVTVSLKLRVDPLRDEVVLPASLATSVVVGEDEVARTESAILFFSEDPIAARGEWLRLLDVQLFDPAGRTESTLLKAWIPFRKITNPSRIRVMNGGTLIVGAGLSMRDYRGLAESTISAAARGTCLLWLSAADGELPLEAFTSASKLSFSDSQVIKWMDKRLDVIPWGGRDLQVTQLRPSVVDDRASAVTAESGWPWLEAHWPKSDGHFVYCGFPIVDGWNDSPTPRYLLLRMLERLHAEESSP
jgi:hypothetical protein